jgi:hypothetical protein
MTTENVSSEQAIALHHRRVRGGKLTPEETVILNNFLAKRDEEETAMLQESAQRSDERAAEQEQKILDLEALLERKKRALARLETIVREIEDLKLEETQLLATTVTTGKAA